MHGRSKKIGILIATSQPSIRSGLKMLLTDESDRWVVAEAQDSHELLKKIEATCPQVVLLDWNLLNRATPILIKTICTLDQDTTLIVLSAESEHQQLALEAGADAFANIGKPPRDLVAIINEMVLTRYFEQ